jgi:uncharacterized SAM-dependent methyltransferase
MISEGVPGKVMWTLPDIPPGLESIRQELKTALLTQPKSIPLVVNYLGERSAELFNALRNNPLYQLPLKEKNALTRLSAEMISIVDAEPVALIELGSGSDIQKAEILSRSLFRRTGLYIATDVDPHALELIDRTPDWSENIQINTHQGDFHSILTDRCIAHQFQAKVYFIAGSTLPGMSDAEISNLLKIASQNFGENDILIAAFDGGLDLGRVEKRYMLRI